MVAPKSTIWRLEPHTRAKHAILERYLQAWMPILTHGGFPEILYIDGFAGPGQYSKGEDGSPIIALKTALRYEPPLRADIHFLFVEMDERRAEFLKSLIEEMVLPENFQVIVSGGIPFDQAFYQYYNLYLRPGRVLIPTFAFIDPFGWKVPFSIVQEIMKHRGCEVFVNFMYEEVNRFLSFRDQSENFDAYFGTDTWRPIAGITDPRERNRQIHDLYLGQLRSVALAQYVRSFEMQNDRNVTDYYLFYATNNLLGLKRMKEAMWKIDESGEFQFSDATDRNQLVLFEKKPDFERLKKVIVDQFGGRAVRVGEIEEFVVGQTAFRETHYKRQVLARLEADGNLMAINALPNRRRGTFSDPNMIVEIST